MLNSNIQEYLHCYRHDVIDDVTQGQIKNSYMLKKQLISHKLPLAQTIHEVKGIVKLVGK